MFESHQSKRSRPSLEEYLGILDALCLRCYAGVYIVIDALNECTDEGNTRQILLKELQQKPRCIRLMVTSREIPSISVQLPTAKQLKISARDEDIMDYVEQRASHTERLSILISEDKELKESLKRSIAEKASGM